MKSQRIVATAQSKIAVEDFELPSHEENLCKGIIWSVHEGARRKPFVVDTDHGRRSRESGEKRPDSARRRQKARSEGRGVREHLRSAHSGLGVLRCGRFMGG